MSRQDSTALGEEGAATRVVSSLRIVATEPLGTSEDIAPWAFQPAASARSPRSRKTRRRRTAPKIARKAETRRNDARGLRIVPNHFGQVVERIAAASTIVPADGEMEHKKLFTRFEEAFLSHDIDSLRDCLSPAFQWHLPNGAAVYGREEALAEMERRFALPDGPRFSGSVWRFKDMTVIQSYDVEFRGADGNWRQSRGTDLYEIGGGLITRKDAFWKMVP